MRDRALVLQARDAIERLVGENPSSVTMQRRAVVDDGFGGTVEDPSGATVPVVLRCRVSHQGAGPFLLGAASVGFSTNLGRYVLTDHLNAPVEGDYFELLGRGWRVGPVDPLVRFGETVGYQAPLVDAGEAEAAT